MFAERRFRVTSLLFVIFALSTWLDLNGVWVELPLIVHQTPEGWSLPSYLSLAVAISNIAPILIMLFKWIFKDRLDERIFIYIEMIIGMISCILMAKYWNKTSFVFGCEHSLLLIFFVFLLGTLDTTSTVTYSDYMKRYEAKFLNALFLGESLTSLIPSVLASCQGVGGEAICSLNSTDPKYSSPRFSVQTYFLLFAVIIFFSLLAFLFLEWSTIAHPFRTENFRSSNVDSFSLQSNNKIESSFLPMSTKIYRILLVIGYFVNIVLFGILPSIGTYAILPYSQHAYYISSLVLPLSNPLSVVLSWIVKARLALSSIFMLSCTATCFAVYIIVIAMLSPCPPLHDTTSGAIIAILCYFISQFLFYYIRIVIANRIRQEFPQHHGLFWLGAVSQMGALSGSVPIYLLINQWNVFQSRAVCQSYC